MACALRMSGPLVLVSLCLKEVCACEPSGDVQRNEGKEAWGMGINFKFPWQKKKEKEDKERAAAEAKK